MRASAASVPAMTLGGARPQRKRENAWQRFRMTREGKAFAFVTVGVGAAAVNTGNNLLFLIVGFMLSLIVMSGILSEIVLRGVRVSRRLPVRAFAGSITLIEVCLKNDKPWAPSYSLEVEDRAEDLPTERRCYFLKVAPQAEQVASYRRTFLRRGYVKLSGFRVATRYPFGMIEKWRMLSAEAELLVYPALLREHELERALLNTGADAPTARVGAGSEVAGLRHYRSGDAARSIHWRRTAALGRVVVYEMHSDSSSRVTILLDNARPAHAGEAWERGFERAISRAAALCVTVIGHELSVEVVCRGQRSPVVMAGSPADPILRFLALLEAVPAEQAPPFGRYGRSRVIQVPVSELESAAEHSGGGKPPGGKRPA